MSVGSWLVAPTLLASAILLSHLREKAPGRAPATVIRGQPSAPAPTQLQWSCVPGEEDDNDPIAYEDRLQQISREITDAELPVAVAALQASSERQNVDLRARLFRRWAENDPRSAARWAESVKDRSLRMAALDDVALVWAQRDFVAAADWAAHLSDFNEASRVLTVALGEAVRTRPIEALSIARELLPGTARDELLQRAAAEWATRDAAAAVQWAREISDPTLRAMVEAHVAVAWADANPPLAAAFTLANLPVGRLQSDTIVSVAQRWAQQDIVGATGLAEELYPGPTKTAAAENVASIWAEKSPADAASWRDSVER